MSFSEIAQPTIDLAENGFPVYESLHRRLDADFGKFTELYPTTGEIYYSNGGVPQVGRACPQPRLRSDAAIPLRR